MFVLTLAPTANTLAKRQRQHNLHMYAPQSWEDTLSLLVELSATAAFALSGLMEAARKKLDAGFL
jgi:nicotinamidase-related amidase